MKWWPWLRREDTTAQAQACLDALERREPQVRHLAAELRELQRRNHFSPMVYAAITRIRET